MRPKARWTLARASAWGRSRQAHGASPWALAAPKASAAPRASVAPRASPKAAPTSWPTCRRRSR
eukprot:3871687-Alexandrium_andersonii.AAC.1